MNRVQIITLGICIFISSYLEAKIPALRQIDFIDEPNILSRLNPFEKNIYALNDRSSKQSKINILPWADHSWKIQEGLLGNRYADSSFNNQSSWEERHAYVMNHSATQILKGLNSTQKKAKIDILSPSEKYDLLVGDPNFTLTHSQWNEGAYYTNNGTLASWMGICEGSAAASIMFPEPKHSVELTSANGDPITFHILDIKALSSLLWSAYNAEIPISGSRCKSKTPQLDANGILSDLSCFNSNPASFHIALLNLLGQRNQVLFINRYMSEQVWNVPIISYSYQYMNVENGLLSNNLNDTLTEINFGNGNVFNKYRAKNAKYILGIEMKIILTKGNTSERDQMTSMVPTEVTYIYDLELNPEGEIIGGEWHSEKHPDFIWAIEPGFSPKTQSDHILSAENVLGDSLIIPNSWLNLIQNVSAKNQPLESIVSKLVKLSTE